MSCQYELIFINDGSKDRTLSILKKISAENDNVTYISFQEILEKKLQCMRVLQCRCRLCSSYGCGYAGSPSLLPEMIKILESGKYDSVATRRENREGEPPIRSWFARKFYQLINKISDADIVDGARDFRLMKREMVKCNRIDGRV